MTCSKRSFRSHMLWFSTVVNLSGGNDVLTLVFVSISLLVSVYLAEPLSRQWKLGGWWHWWGKRAM